MALAARARETPIAPATAPEFSFRFKTTIAPAPPVTEHLVPELHTVQGKPRLRVYVACLQCRNRKIRCDGAKPECTNCMKRGNSASGSREIECDYDSAPKRRGPDKKPGARQRTVKRKPALERADQDSAPVANHRSSSPEARQPKRRKRRATPDDLDEDSRPTQSSPSHMITAGTLSLPPISHLTEAAHSPERPHHRLKPHSQSRLPHESPSTRNGQLYSLPSSSSLADRPSIPIIPVTSLAFGMSSSSSHLLLRPASPPNPYPDYRTSTTASSAPQLPTDHAPFSTLQRSSYNGSFVTPTSTPANQHHYDPGDLSQQSASSTSTSTSSGPGADHMRSNPSSIDDRIHHPPEPTSFNVPTSASLYSQSTHRQSRVAPVPDPDEYYGGRRSSLDDSVRIAASGHARPMASPSSAFGRQQMRIPPLSLVTSSRNRRRSNTPTMTATETSLLHALPSAHSATEFLPMLLTPSTAGLLPGTPSTPGLLPSPSYLLLPSPSGPSTSASHLTLPSISHSLLTRKRKSRDEFDGEGISGAVFGADTTTVRATQMFGQNSREGESDIRQSGTEFGHSPSATAGADFVLPQRDDWFPPTNLRADVLANHRAAFYHAESSVVDSGLGAGTVPRAFESVALHRAGFEMKARTMEYAHHKQDAVFEMPSPRIAFEPEEYEFRITPEPSLQFVRQTWWDNLLHAYSADRETSKKQISEDLKSLFEVGQQFLAFVNVPLFYATFHDPILRDAMQPSFVLAVLSLSTFLRSSDAELGAHGRRRALALRDMAQSALDVSMNAGWIDLELGMAAWVIVQFEISAHPLHTLARAESAMRILESVIKITGYNTIDKDDPRVTRFAPSAVPVVPPSPSFISSGTFQTGPNDLLRDSPPHAIAGGRVKHCTCSRVALGSLNPSSNTLTPLWVTSPGWGPHWTLAEIKKEQTRRLVWNSLILATTMNGDAAANNRKQSFGFLVDCSNYAVLFPGENLVQEGAGKETVWALYTRCMMLWNACVQMRSRRGIADNAKAAFAIQAWIETVTIEDALDLHACSTERALIFLGREYLFNTRMCISWEFRRYIPTPETGFNPIFNRPKAQEWLEHQGSVAHRLMQGLNTITGMGPNLLVKRPSYVWWFMSQANRALTLWTLDESLVIAVEVCLAFLPPIEFLARLWPCPSQRMKYSLLRSRVIQACAAVGLPPPPDDDPLDLLAL